RLTVRAAELGLDAEQTDLALQRPPLRVLVDGHQRVPLDAPFFQAGPVLVTSASSARAETYRAAGHELLALANAEGRVDLPALLAALAERGANEVLLEAGPRLAGAFAALGLIDEYQIFVAAKFLGSSARPLLDLPLERMSEARELKILDIRAVGDDWKICVGPGTAQAKPDCFAIGIAVASDRHSQRKIARTLQIGRVCGKNCAGPRQAQRSQGGVKLPTGGNGVKAGSVASARQAR